MAPILDKFTGGGGKPKKYPNEKFKVMVKVRFMEKNATNNRKSSFSAIQSMKTNPRHNFQKIVWPRCCRTDGKKLGEEQLAPPPPNLLKMAVFNLMSLLKPGYTCDVARYDYHPVVCNKLRTVYAGRYPLVIHCSHYVNRKPQNCTCKHPFRPRYLL